MIAGKWHVWQGASQVLLSNEETKELTYHAGKDAVVNFLWLSGHKEAARTVNKEFK